MSRDISGSGSKPAIEFVCSLSKREDDFGLAKCTVRVSSRSTSLLLAETGTSTVARASKKVTMSTTIIISLLSFTLFRYYTEKKRAKNTRNYRE